MYDIEEENIDQKTKLYFEELINVDLNLNYLKKLKNIEFKEEYKIHPQENFELIFSSALYETNLAFPFKEFKKLPILLTFDDELCIENDDFIFEESELPKSKLNSPTINLKSILAF